MVSRRPEVTNTGRKSDEFEAESSATGGPQPSKPLPRIAFGPFVADPESGRLFEGERLIPLAPKPFETLLYLARRPGRVVSRADLMQALWRDTYVTDDVLVQCVVDIRRALADDARRPVYVETLPRRGYRFVAEPRELRPGESAAGPAEPAAAEAREVAPPASASPRGHRAATAAIGVVFAALAGLAFWGANRRAAPVSRAPAATAATQQGSLLVLPLEIQQPSPELDWLREGLAEILRSELGRRPGVHLVARHRLEEAVTILGLTPGAVRRGDEALALGRSLGAEHLVTGTFVRLGDRFVLTARLVTLPGGGGNEEIAVRGRYTEDLLDSVDDLCLRIAERWRGPEGSSEASWRPVRFATRSVEAFRRYAEAQDSFARGGRQGAAEAERRLDAAIELDPAFAYAHLKKAEIQQWRRRLGYGDADPAPSIRSAVALAEQLSERERLLVSLLEAWLVRRDTAAALSTAGTLLRLHPTYAGEVGVARLAAEIRYGEGRWLELIAEGEPQAEEPSLPVPDRALLSALVAKAYRQRGELERALALARRATRLWPVDAGPSLLRQRADLGRICLDAGRREEALAEFRAVSESRDADVANLTDAGWGLYMAGRPEEAARVAERALALDESYGNVHHLIGWLALARADHAAAAASFERAYARTPALFGAVHLGFLGGDVAALYYAGVAHQKQGQRLQAEATFRRVKELCARFLASEARGAAPIRDFEARAYRAMAAARLGERAEEPPRLAGDDATYFLQSARLHAVQGRRELALRELAQALSLAAGERQHAHDDPNFESLRGDPEFRRLTAAP